jgi:hypothetical protein
MTPETLSTFFAGFAAGCALCGVVATIASCLIRRK